MVGQGRAAPIVIVDLVGDIDGMGGEVSGGSVSGTFDHRSAGELAATDGAQLTDEASGFYGTYQANSLFTHTYSIPGSTTISSASWRLGAGGIQSLNDRLYLDGVLLSSTFPEQGPNGFGIISWVIPASFFPSLLDGTAVFRVNLNSNTSGEPSFYDFAELTINGDAQVVPEPSSIVLFGMGAIGLFGYGWRRKRKQAA
jgi:hypothetical protein